MAKGTVIAIITAFAESYKSFPFTSNRNRHEAILSLELQLNREALQELSVENFNHSSGWEKIYSIYVPTLNAGIWIPQSGFKH